MESTMATLGAMMATKLMAMGKLYFHKIIEFRCSSTCSVEPGYNCTGGSSTSQDTCSEICGDGVMLNSRPSSTFCDDGNNDPNDGCSATC
jgi:cysteine-rich repeat protein